MCDARAKAKEHAQDMEVIVDRIGIKNLAAMVGITYAAARDHGDEEKIEQYLRDGIRKHGVESGKKCKETLGPGPVDCLELKKVFGEGTTRQWALEAEFLDCTPERMQMDVHNCPMLELWKSKGFDEATCHLLCEIVMGKEQGFAEALGLKLNVEQDLEGEDKCCKIIYHR